MASTLIRPHFERHRLGWICAGSAVLGVLFGAALSVQLADHPGPGGSGEVQRLTLHGDGAPASPAGTQQAGSDAPTDQDTKEQASSSPERAQDTSPDADISGAAQASARALPQSRISSNDQALLRTDFDLADITGETQAIEVTKPIHLDGRAIGVASLSIDRNSRLLVSSKDLGRLLPSELFARIDSEASHVGFDELRDAGLDIRYDPLADTIRIKS